MKIILASASPRRKELLEQLGLSFEIIPSTCEEVITKTIPQDVVLELATQKAQDIFSITNKNNTEDCLIIGADTIVTYDSKIMGKPKDEHHAASMLSLLQGKEHTVYTGVCVITNLEGKVTNHSFYEATKVFMYPMNDQEIASYIDSKEPMDKAGAYGIQGLCAKFIEKIQGDYNNVVGLPIGRLWQETLKHVKG